MSLVIEPGQRIALAGPSGSGKSTLLRLISGALRPTAGRVLVDGRDLARFTTAQLARHRRQLGMVEQGANLVPQLTVHDNVVAGRVPRWPWYRTLASLVWPLERDETATLLERVGLADRQWDPTSILSGGQQQRVAIARALAADAPTILADEPTASLDPATARDMVALLLDETDGKAATVVFCTHWVSLVSARADRLIGLREGRVVIDAPAADVSDAALDELYAGSRERR